jgi:adenine-specific DNA-methyltransferase
VTDPRISAVLEGRERWHLSCADAAEFSAALPADSVDLLLTDPPYFKFKGEVWDQQWDKPDQFLSWLGSLLDDWRRVLKPNGSLYVFASPQMAARVELEIGQRFSVLNHVVWEKPLWGEPHTPGRSCKEELRTFFPWSERIIFAEHFGADNAAKGEAGYGAKCDELRGFVFEPLRAYLDGERERAGVAIGALHEAWCEMRGTRGHMVGHWFGRAQWALPTAVNYQWLREQLESRGGQYLRREYEDLRRPFNVSADVPYTDVWTFPTVQAYPGKHPCEKPEPLIAHIVKASSKPDAVVADFFSGSGVVGAVATALGRRFLGCEIDETWAERGRARVKSGRRLRIPDAALPDVRQVPLFGEAV